MSDQLNFRYHDGYEDVFVEQDEGPDEGSEHYLYVCREPFGWPYLLACQPWDRSVDIYGKPNGEWRQYDHTGASVEYLQSLTPAPDEVAREIIRMDAVNRITIHNIGLSEDDDDYWGDDMVEVLTCEW